MEGDAGQNAPRALSLYDASNKLIGAVAGLGCPLTVGGSRFENLTAWLNIDGIIFSACAQRNGLRADMVVLYFSADCSGDGYQVHQTPQWPANADGIFPSVGIGNLQGKLILFRPDYASGQQVINVNSYRHNEDGICVTGAGNYAVTAYRLIQVEDLSSLYTAPFSVK